MTNQQKVNFMEEMSELFSDIFKTPIRFVDINEKDFARDEDCYYCGGCKNSDEDMVKFEGTVTPQKVIINNPATIIYWTDGTKTVVKCHADDMFDAEKGIAMATLKKLCGNTGKFNLYLNACLENAIVRRA